MTSQTTAWQAEFAINPDQVHPWYGPCDAMGADGGCAECDEVAHTHGYAEAKAAWWAAIESDWLRERERKANKKMRRPERATHA